MPTSTSTLSNRSKHYGSSFTTTQPRYTSRPLPQGPGPLDTSGHRMLSRLPPSTSRPSRLDHHTTVTYETTSTLTSTHRSPSITDLKRTNNDTFSSVYGRRTPSVDSSTYRTYTNSSSGLYGDDSSYERKYGTHTTSSSLPRRGSISDRISQFEPTSRNSEPSYSGRKTSVGLASSPSTTQKDTRGLTGLRNLRNTCFMSSILQCLSNTRPLLEYCLNDDFLLDINDRTSHMKGHLIRAYANLMQEMWKKNGDNCVSPTAFKSSIAKFAPRFVGYSQQDSQEFLRHLLEGLHEDVNRVTSRLKLPFISESEDEKISDKAKFYWERYLKLERSIIVDIFVGQLRSTLKCTYCDYESTTFDPFWDLSLPIPKYSTSIQLSDCLKLFTAEEVLDGDEKPTCARCKARRKCTKRFSIQKFPQVLVLHLKRFSGERFRSKLTTMVHFPVADLDVSRFSADSDGSPNHRYNLTGVSNHSGTVFSGHYTAYCKHPYRDDWHEYNDHSVRPIPARSVVSSEAYVLFYELADKKSRL